MLLASVATAKRHKMPPDAQSASGSRPGSAAVHRGAPLRKMLQDAAAASGVGDITRTVVASGPPSPLQGLTANDANAAYGESIGWHHGCLAMHGIAASRPRNHWPLIGGHVRRWMAYPVCALLGRCLFIAAEAV